MEGTTINYPVVQNDNNDFYLDHNFYKEPDRVGAIFMDYRNSNRLRDDHTIIYGHHMKDQSMFASLEDVLGKEFSEESEIKLELKDQTYEWKIFSAYVTSDTGWMQIDFKSDDAFGDFKTNLTNDSKREFHTQLNNKKILTLATCTTETSDNRIVVHAQLVERN